jgi:isopentenyldiphosphate isomerase
MDDNVDFLSKELKQLAIVRRDIAHKNNNLHRIAVVYFFTKTGKIIIQKHKSDGLFDHSAGGHVNAGELSGPAASRELEEELGVERRFFSTEYAGSVINEGDRFNHLIDVFYVIYAHDYTFLETEEVKDHIEVTPQQLIDMVKTTPQYFTTDFLTTFATYFDIIHIAYCSTKGRT